MILQATTWNAVRRSRRASKKGETPCPVMPDKRKILCQDRGPHTKRNFKYGKELCLLVGGSAKARHEER